MALLLLATAEAVAPADVRETFICEHKAGWSNLHQPLREDLRIVREGPKGNDTGRWTVVWPADEPRQAQRFDAQFGSVGGSLGLQWQDKKGKKRRAFMAFGDDEVASGDRYAWLSLNSPSLWEGPGFFCATEGLAKKETKQ